MLGAGNGRYILLLFTILKRLGSFSGWDEEEYRTRLNVSIKDYDMAVGLNNALTPVWTFWNAMFLAGRSFRFTAFSIKLVPLQK